MDIRQRQWIEALTGAEFDSASDTDWFSLAFPDWNQPQAETVAATGTGSDPIQSRWFDSDDEEEDQSRWFDSDEEGQEDQSRRFDSDEEGQEDQSRRFASDEEGQEDQSRWFDSDEEGREDPDQSRRLDSGDERSVDNYSISADPITSYQHKADPSEDQNVVNALTPTKRADDTGYKGQQDFAMPSMPDAPNNAALDFVSRIDPETDIGGRLSGKTSNRTNVAGNAGANDNVADEQDILLRIQNTHGLLVNSFTHNGAGWATNLLHATAREASITWITTMVRETLGYFAAQKLGGATDRTKVAISSSILALTGILNVVASVRQEAQKKANWTTRTAHASTLALLGGATAIAHKTTGLGSVAPLLIKATGYCLSRDGINLFIRLSSNRDDPLSLKSIATEVAVYAVNQYIVNELQSSGLSLSGTSDEAQAHSYREIFARLAAFSAANAAGESFDAFVYPALVAFYNEIGSGLHESLKAVGEIRLAAKFHLPMGEKLVARFPAAEGIVGGVTVSEAADKVLGPMTARQSVFVVLLSLLNLLSKAGAAARFSPEGTTHLVNALAGISLGLLGSVFLGALATSSPPPATIQPEIV
ncbi:hypothetical protein FFK22_041295 [Mycobacterium sp. KBS0706]|uniref:hypothetical protein n=1 Tax=Mycobacterium sp. KBS0706 TaxID=2578109 RepID=UPI00110FF206|nr:hypothetical protein [Mycobacterium sp. KBS0706]TSD82781.1 hypothetical protein FFK22_041295 [Mycobacterium sp. KBS0706]